MKFVAVNKPLISVIHCFFAAGIDLHGLSLEYEYKQEDPVPDGYQGVRLLPVETESSHKSRRIRAKCGGGCDTRNLQANVRYKAQVSQIHFIPPVLSAHRHI